MSDVQASEARGEQKETVTFDRVHVTYSLFN